MPGGQSALSSTFRALAAPGEAVVMEAPTFWGAIAAARQAELRIVPLAREGDAVSPSALDAALATSRAKLFYAQPHFANPTGAVWSDAQADETMAVLRAHGAYLVEDDWAHDFALDVAAPPVAARDVDGRVIYIRSLTKSVSPAIRVAAVIARGPARARIQTDRTVNDLYVSGILQSAALEVVSAPSRAAHLRAVHAQLRSRRDALARLVMACCPRERRRERRPAASTRGCACPATPPRRWRPTAARRPASSSRRATSGFRRGRAGSSCASTPPVRTRDDSRRRSAFSPYSWDRAADRPPPRRAGLRLIGPAPPNIRSAIRPGATPRAGPHRGALRVPLHAQIRTRTLMAVRSSMAV